ncbi:MAG: PAS domain-containing protein, partial [Arcobacteraceae bacterium]
MFKNISSSFKITLTYLIFGVIWIYVSDTLTNVIFQNIKDVQLVQFLKGWLFILISALMLYFLSKKLFSNLLEAKNQATEAKNLLENIIDNAPMRIFWKDKNGVYLGANKFLLADIGFTHLHDLIGKNDTQINIKEAQEYINDDNFIMNNNTKKLNYIETLTDKNGKRRILNTSKVPLLNASNQVVGMIGVYQDITQKVEIENQIKKQDALILQQSKF